MNNSDLTSNQDPEGYAPADLPRLRSRGPTPRSAPAGAPVARLKRSRALTVLRATDATTKIGHT